MNLAVNAKHAMPHGGTLTIESKNIQLSPYYCEIHPDVTPGKYVMLSLSDTGCGMDKETQSRIFEPFFTTRDPDKGTGLGLAMVYGIIKNHEGQVECYSEIDQGTIFKIYIPAVDNLDESVSLTSPEEEPVVGGTENILVVDDDPSIRYIAKKLLMDAGYRVSLAVDGSHALKIHHQSEDVFNLIILDINMPVMGGVECMDRLREQDTNLPILLASGFPCSKACSDRLGSRLHYIDKPFHEKQLLQAVRSLLDFPAKKS